MDRFVAAATGGYANPADGLADATAAAANGTCLWHEATIRQNARRATRLACAICGAPGGSDVRVENHLLCIWRRWYGVPTPPVSTAAPCPCMACRRTVPESIRTYGRA